MGKSVTLTEDYKGRVARLMKESGMKQDEMAAALGVSRSAIAQYQRMRTDLPLELIETFCRLVEVSVEYLITGRDNPIVTAYMALSGDDRRLADKVLGLEKKGDDPALITGKGDFISLPKGKS